MALNRFQLQNMVKKEQEGFKEYAQRWRELAMQVKPPITKREMVTMFINTFPSPYYDRVVENVASNFADVVVVGFVKKPTLEKKKGETNAILVELVFHQKKVDAPSYPTRIQVGSRSATMPLVPYIPPCQARADAGATTSTRPAQQSTRRPPRTLAPILYHPVPPFLIILYSTSTHDMHCIHNSKTLHTS
ncbi:hypothetical protein CR513_45677, partial [Mucuna pruriens]